MTRVISTVERNVICLPGAPIAIPNNAPTDVLPDVSVEVGTEYAGRYIQNVGSNACYYSIGHDCNGATNCHGYLAQYQQLAIGASSQKVSVYCTGGTTIATTIYKRNDLNQGRGGIL